MKQLTKSRNHLKYDHVPGFWDKNERDPSSKKKTSVEIDAETSNFVPSITADLLHVQDAAVKEVIEMTIKYWSQSNTCVQ